MPRENFEVRWEVADDDAMKRVVRRGAAVADLVVGAVGVALLAARQPHRLPFRGGEQRIHELLALVGVSAVEELVDLGDTGDAADEVDVNPAEEGQVIDDGGDAPIATTEGVDTIIGRVARSNEPMRITRASRCEGRQTPPAPRRGRTRRLPR